MTPFLSHKLPFAVNLWLAARLMPLFAKRGSLEGLLRMATPVPGAHAYDEIGADEILRAVKAAVSRPWRMRGRRCLREGLLAFHYLSLAGYRPVLHFGLVPGSLGRQRPGAHCWISLDGREFLNAPAEPLVDLFAYDGRSSVPADRLSAAQVHDHG